MKLTFKEHKYRFKRKLKDLLSWLTYLLTGSFFRKQPIQKVCVFHIGRSGSTLLADLFTQNKHTHWDGKKISRWLVDNPTMSMSQKTFEKYVYRRSIGRKEKWYCLEIEQENLTRLDFSIEHLFQSLQVLGFDKIIVLERKNYLHSIISRKSAINTGIWHLRKATENSNLKFILDLTKPLPHISNLTIVDLLKSYAMFFKKISEYSELKKITLLLIDYELDIAIDPHKAYTKICKFLAVNNDKVHIRFAKTSNQSPLSYIDNKNELKDALKGTEFEWMLN